MRGEVVPLEGFWIMGVVNVTPDSFYAGSRARGADAVARALRAWEEGAQVVDIGGESTRPGAREVPVEEEKARVLPVIEGIRERRPEIRISIDTRKSAVAESARRAGAWMVIDVSGFQFDPRMAEVVAEYGVPVVIQHMRGTPETMQKDTHYEDLFGEICAFFERQMRWLERCGGSAEQVILDPGIGFGKDYAQNLHLLAGIRRFLSFGRPVLVGPSRKSYIGHFLGGVPPEERLEGTLVSLAVAYFSGARWFRVHDVLPARRALQMAEAFQRETGFPGGGSG